MFTITRTILNTGYRMPYPFLPIFAAGLGVPLEAVSQAVAAARLLGVLAPMLGAAVDRLGRKTAMLLGMTLFALGLAAVAIVPTYWLLFFAIMMIAGGKIIFDPALQAYIGDRVSYSQRGLAIAVVEMGWSGAFLIGMPLSGALIAHGGWYAPFGWLAVCGAVSVVLLWRILPSQTGAVVSVRASLWRNLRSVLTHPTSLAALGMGLFMSAANEIIEIIFGEWLKQQFDLTAASLGGASTVIGVAELGGEGLVATLVDRLGKRRAVIIGCGLNALMCLLLPILGKTFVGAMVGLFLIFITFEFALVSSLPLMTEIIPEARATLMSTNVSSLSAGRAAGAIIGTALFLRFGVLGNSLAAAALDVVAVGLMLVAVRQD
jgi:predicted MFS family arabinose efflux permease